MATGNHLNIGPNIGEASYWDPNGAIKPFTDMLAYKKAEQAKKDQDLINQASQLKPEAIRDADREDYINKYNDWKQTQIAANQLPNNSRQRLDQLATAQSKYNDLNRFIYESKKEASNEHGVANMRLQNPHLFSDDANGQLIKSMQSPMSSSQFIPGNNYNQLERYIDHSKVDEGFDAAYKEQLKQQEWSNPIQSQGRDKQGNKTGVVVHNERQIEPEDVLSTAAHMYTLSPDIRASIDKRYPNIEGQSPQETMMLRLRQNAIDRGDFTVGANGQLQPGLSEKTKPEFKANYKPDNFYEHYWFKQAHKDDAGVPNAPQNQNIPFASGGVSNAPNYVPLSLPNKNFAGATGIALKNGQPEAPLNSSDSYSIVGAGDFPIIKKGVGYNDKISGSLAQPNFAKSNPNDVEYKRMVHVREKTANEDYVDHLIPYENLPKNVANQKDVRQSLSGLNKTAVYSTQSQQKTTPQDFDSQWAKIPKGGTLVGPDGVTYTKK